MSTSPSQQPPPAAAAAGVPAGPPTRSPAEPAGNAPGGRAGRGPTSPPASSRPAGARSDREGQLRRLTHGFTALFLEVEAGRRPRRHLEPLMTPLLYARLAPVWVRGGWPGRVIAVRGMAGADHAYEAVAVVRRGARYGALGLRLVRTGEGWRVDEVARPEEGPLPPPEFLPPPDEPDSFDLVLAPAGRGGAVVRAQLALRTGAR